MTKTLKIVVKSLKMFEKKNSKMSKFYQKIIKTDQKSKLFKKK
jgi:hypothetical protein